MNRTAWLCSLFRAQHSKSSVILADGNQRTQVKDEQECHPLSEGPAPVIDPLKSYVYSCYYAPRMAKRDESRDGQNITCAHTWPVCKISTDNLLRKPYLKQLPFTKPKSTFIQVFNSSNVYWGRGAGAAQWWSACLVCKRLSISVPSTDLEFSRSIQTGLLELGHETQMPHSHQTEHCLKDTYVE